MLKQPKNGVSGSNNWSRICDTCRSAPCTIYCHADLAYLCSACDARIHVANRLASRHDRVWLCEACERAPAAFLCKADAASLCHSCDADIHSANPLAARHHRVPISPPPPPPSSDDSPFLPDDAEDDDDDAEDDVVDEEDEHEAASWLLVNPIKTTTNNTNTAAAAAASATTTTINNNNNHHSSSFLFGGEVDEYLDLMDSNSCGDNHYSNINHHYDSVVPVQQQPHHFHLALDLDSSKSPAYPYNANPSLSQNVSFSSVDVGIVPESTAMSGGGDVSVGQYSRPPKGTIDLFTGPPLPLEIPSQLSPMDREARVLRYREKKKTRKFQKTIRYASRKAYAETRPRIKGRFAKRTEVEAEVDQMFSTTLMTENGGYGIVPSF